MRNQTLRAIEELTGALLAAQSGTTPEGYATIKRGISLSIGRIQMEILEPIYAVHPDLDDINHPESM